MSTAAVNRELREMDAKREAAAPEIARQVRNRSRKKADGGVHNVKRSIAKSRVQEAATVTEVDRGPEKRWSKSSSLPAMPPLAGFHVEYVRRDNRDRGDHANLIEHLQEQWDFVRRSDYPGKVLPTQKLDDYGECIGNASSILMKIPNHLYAQRNAYYSKRRDKTTKQVNSPDPKNSLGGGAAHELMPIVEDKILVTSTAGRHRARKVERAEE
jgi:hypothetical protein